MAAPRRTRRATDTEVTGRPTLGRLVVATRGDQSSTGALHLAAELAKRSSARVVALGVMSPGPRRSNILVAQSVLSTDEKARRALLESIRDRVKHIDGAHRWVKRAVIGMP